jgi:hypothetical protein
VVLISVYWLSRRSEQGIAREHGPMENFQVVCLSLAVLVLWTHAWRIGEAGARWFAGLGGLGCFTMLLLELDVRPFGINALTFWLNGMVRNLWVGALWVGGVVLAWKHRARIAAYFCAWIFTPAPIVFAASASFWAAGAILEKLHFDSRADEFFWEELMEVNGAWLMLWAVGEMAFAPIWFEKVDLPPAKRPTRRAASEIKNGSGEC